MINFIRDECSSTMKKVERVGELVCSSGSVKRRDAVSLLTNDATYNVDDHA